MLWLEMNEKKATWLISYFLKGSVLGTDLGLELTKPHQFLLHTTSRTTQKKKFSYIWFFMTLQIKHASDWFFNKYFRTFKPRRMVSYTKPSLLRLYSESRDFWISSWQSFFFSDWTWIYRAIKSFSFKSDGKTM